MVIQISNVEFTTKNPGGNRETSYMIFLTINVLKFDKNSLMGHNSKSGLQLYSLVSFQLHHPDESSGQARAHLVFDPPQPPDQH